MSLAVRAPVLTSFSCFVFKRKGRLARTTAFLGCRCLDASVFVVFLTQEHTGIPILRETERSKGEPKTHTPPSCATTFLYSCFSSTDLSFFVPVLTGSPELLVCRRPLEHPGFLGVCLPWVGAIYHWRKVCFVQQRNRNGFCIVCGWRPERAHYYEACARPALLFYFYFFLLFCARTFFVRCFFLLMGIPISLATTRL